LVHTVGNLVCSPHFGKLYKEWSGNFSFRANFVSQIFWHFLEEHLGQRAILNFTPGVNLAPRGEICLLGVMFTPFVHPHPGVNTLYHLE
jgi:hypothetical protein